jgi:signal transduction histidine kinase
MTLNECTTGPQFKYSAGIALLLVAASSAIFYFTAFDSTASIEHQVMSRIVQLRDSLVPYDTRWGIRRLVELVQGGAILPARDDVFISIVDASGASLLHTSDEILTSEAWEALKAPRGAVSRGSGLNAHHLFVASAPLSEGKLLVGQSDRKFLEARRSLFIRFALLNGAAIAALSLFDLFFRRRAHSRIVAMKATLAAFNSGATDRRVSFSEPIDCYYELAYAINETLDRTQVLIQNLNYTSSDVAHNLKKPLTRLRQRLEVMYDGDLSDAGFKSKIGEAIEEIDSLAAKFEALLNIGQLQSGDHRSRFVDVDLKSLLTHVIELYEPMIVDSWQKLEVAIPPGPVGTVRGDRELLMEMLVNFIENAILHCPPGTKIRIALCRSMTGITITISDDGPGIPPSEIENVFRRFYRLDASRTKPGHGLGVPCSVAIAELHRARIELSDNKPGLKVEIHFPTNSGKKLPKLGLRPRSGLRV